MVEQSPLKRLAEGSNPSSLTYMERKISRRDLIRFAAGAAGAVVLTACAGEQVSPSESPTPSETEPMKQFVNDMRLILPEFNPGLKYLRAGSYIKELGCRQVDSHYLILNTGEKGENAEKAVSVLVEVYKTATKMNNSKLYLDDIVVPEQFRRVVQDPFREPDELSLEIPERSRKDFVRVAITGPNESLFLISTFPFSYPYTLKPFNFERVIERETTLPDTCVFTVDTSSRMKLL